MSSLPEESRGAEWFTPSSEGQLAVDVFREGDTLVIRSMAAGVRPSDVDISIHGDLLTLRGTREASSVAAQEDWFHRECYWGTFSRSIVLPYEVAPDSANASLKNGILEIRLTIRQHGKKVPVKWGK